MNSPSELNDLKTFRDALRASISPEALDAMSAEVEAMQQNGGDIWLKLGPIEAAYLVNLLHFGLVNPEVTGDMEDCGISLQCLLRRSFSVDGALAKAWALRDKYVALKRAGLLADETDDAREPLFPFLSPTEANAAGSPTSDVFSDANAQRAAGELAALTMQGATIRIELDLVNITFLISNLHYALAYPENEGRTAQMAERLIADLRRHFPPDGALNAAWETLGRAVLADRQKRADAPASCASATAEPASDERNPQE